MMNDMTLTLEDITGIIKPIAERDVRIEAVYVLGSVASGRVHPKSDIDLAILPVTPKALSTFDQLTLTAQLEDHLSYVVDIGLLGTHDVVYAVQAIVNGVCIFTRDRFKRDLAAATCLALYADLKQQRREVEHAYTA
jgi:predicted nucleotidyltransferase